MPEQAPSTAHQTRPGRLRRALSMLGLTLTVAAGAGAAGAAAHETVLHHTTATERLIGDALDRSLGGHTLVRCLSPAQMRHRQLRSGQTLDGLAMPYVPLIYLLDDDCRLIAGVAATAAQDPHALDNMLPAPVTAMHNAMHEDWHTKGELSETGAQCRAVQTIGIFAAALGVAPQAAAMLPVIDGQNLLRREQQGELPRAYWFQNCYLGGPYDVHQLPAADFPQPPPDISTWAPAALGN